MDATLRIEIFPADVERSAAFYRRLGFEVTGPDDGYASFRLGGVRIGAAEREPVDPALRHVPAGTEIVIEVDDVRAAHDGLVGAGVDIAEGLRDRPWGLTDFRLHDPDGYYLRFTSRS